VITIINEERRKLSQEEFNAIMKEHAAWQYDDDTGTRAEFCGVDLTQCDLTKRDLSHCIFRNANLKSVNFEGSDLRFTTFASCNLNGIKAKDADFSESVFKYCNISNCECEASNFTLANFEYVSLFDSDFVNASFGEAILEACTLRDSLLSSADFSRSEIAHCHFSRSTLKGASFQFACVKNTSFQSAFLQNVDFRNALLGDVDFSDSCIFNVDVSGANVFDCNFLNTKIKDTALAVLYAGYYTVVFMKSEMLIGCIKKTYSDWLEVDEVEAESLCVNDGGDFFKTWREPLFKIRHSLISILGEVPGELPQSDNPMENFLQIEGVSKNGLDQRDINIQARGRAYRMIQEPSNN